MSNCVRDESAQFVARSWAASHDHRNHSTPGRPHSANGIVASARRGGEHSARQQRPGGAFSGARHGAWNTGRVVAARAGGGSVVARFDPGAVCVRRTQDAVDRRSRTLLLSAGGAEVRARRPAHRHRSTPERARCAAGRGTGVALQRDRSGDWCVRSFGGSRRPTAATGGGVGGRHRRAGASGVGARFAVVRGSAVAVGAVAVGAGSAARQGGSAAMSIFLVARPSSLVSRPGDRRCHGSCACIFRTGACSEFGITGLTCAVSRSR